ncbi:YraN family protein [Nocardiopsis sp. CNT-189]|uniref:YraN family protein n=1 Tax=Nocardiopsis oceanisediminis TaxID=2816862 RepID=UPI003B2D6226
MGFETRRRTWSRAALARYGEDLAAAHLRRTGLRILARNWRCREGEIDILARWGGTLIVVEVKTRTGLRFGTPLEAVDRSKRRRLRRLARLWREENRRAAPPRTRVDVIGVLVRRDGRAYLRHDRGVA